MFHPHISYDHIYIVLNRPRQVLYENAEKRVDKMISLGLMEEVKFLSQKYGWECQAMQAIGYKEWRQYLEENVDLEDVISQIKINTRHYVKRQLTWFRRTKNAVWLEADKIEENILLVKGMINNQK